MFIKQGDGAILAIIDEEESELDESILPKNANSVAKRQLDNAKKLATVPSKAPIALKSNVKLEN